MRLPAWPPSGGKRAGEDRRPPPVALPPLVNQFLTTPPSPSLTKRFRPLSQRNVLANKILLNKWLRLNKQFNIFLFFF